MNKALNHFPSTLAAARGPAAGQITLRLQGEPAAQYILQGATNFTAWTPVTTNTTARTGRFTNTLSTAANPFRF